MKVIASPYVLFPECPGYGFAVQPWYLVNIVVREQGFERCDSRWERCLNVFTAVPMGPRDEETIQSVLYFWHAMGGRAGIFRFRDWSDYKSCPTQSAAQGTDQPLVHTTLADSSSAYRLVKQYVVGALAGTREITQPDASTLVVKNSLGATQTDFTVDEGTGLVVPGPSFTGTPHSWGGEFYVPVRFDSELDTSVADKQIQSVTFTLREKRIRLPTALDTGSPEAGASPGAGSPGGGGGSPGGGSPGGPEDGGSPSGPIAGPITWRAGTPTPDTFGDTGVSGGIAAAVGFGGTVYTATHADFYDTWTPRTTGADGLSVGIGGSTIISDHNSEDGTVLRSTNGGSSFSPVSTGLSDLIYGLATDGGGNWIAFSAETQYATSADDGATWSVRDASGSTDLANFVNGCTSYDPVNHLFVCLGFTNSSSPAYYVVSLDGTTVAENVFASGVAGTSGKIMSDGVTLMLGVKDTVHAGKTIRFATTVAGLISTTGVDSGFSTALVPAESAPPDVVLAGGGNYFAIGRLGGVVNSDDKTTWNAGTLNMGSDGPHIGSEGFYDLVHNIHFVCGDGGSKATFR